MVPVVGTNRRERLHNLLLCKVLVVVVIAAVVVYLVYFFRFGTPRAIRVDELFRQIEVWRRGSECCVICNRRSYRVPNRYDRQSFDLVPCFSSWLRAGTIFFVLGRPGYSPSKVLVLTLRNFLIVNGETPLDKDVEYLCLLNLNNNANGSIWEERMEMQYSM
jgi:hypothetical protein